MVPERSPLMTRKGDPAAAHPDAFLLESDALREHAAHAPPRADSAARVHHAMPRHVARAPVHRVPHRAGRARPPEQQGELTVRCYAATGNAPHETPYGLREGHPDRLRVPSSQSRAYSPPSLSSSA